MCSIRSFLTIGHLYLSGMWLGVNLRTDTKKTCIFRRIRLRAQNMPTILGSKAKSLRGGGNLYDHLMSTQILTFLMNKIFIWALSTMKKMATGTLWICQSSCTNFVFHSLQDVGVERSPLTIRYLPHQVSNLDIFCGDGWQLIVLSVTGALNTVLSPAHQREMRRYLYNHQVQCMEGGLGY